MSWAPGACSSGHSGWVPRSPAEPPCPPRDRWRCPMAQPQSCRPGVTELVQGHRCVLTRLAGREGGRCSDRPGESPQGGGRERRRGGRMPRRGHGEGKGEVLSHGRWTAALRVAAARRRRVRSGGRCTRIRGAPLSFARGRAVRHHGKTQHLPAPPRGSGLFMVHDTRCCPCSRGRRTLALCASHPSSTLLWRCCPDPSSRPPSAPTPAPAKLTPQSWTGADCTCARGRPGFGRARRECV